MANIAIEECGCGIVVERQTLILRVLVGVVTISLKFHTEVDRYIADVNIGFLLWISPVDKKSVQIHKHKINDLLSSLENS